MYSNLEKNKANYWALTPISFLVRTANIWPEKTAWIHGSKKNTYEELHTRCLKISNGLKLKGIKKRRHYSCYTAKCPSYDRMSFCCHDGRCHFKYYKH